MLASQFLLDLQQINSFIALVETHSLAGAAERVSRTQPAVIAQLRKLENMLGCALFTKSGRRLVINDNGEALYHYAKALLKLNHEAVEAISRIQTKRPVRLGLIQDFAETVLPEVLVAIRETEPDQPLEICVDSNAMLREKRRAGDLDLVLTYVLEAADHASVIGSTPMVWLSGEGPSDVVFSSGCVPLVVYEAPCAIRQIAIDSLNRTGYPWQIAMTSTSLQSQFSAVSAGMGVGVRTRIAVGEHLSLIERQDLPLLPRLNIALLGAENVTDESPLAQGEKGLIPVSEHIKQAVLAVLSRTDT